MVITRGALCEIVPIENVSMPGRTVIEWDKDDLDELGILKVDCLSLSMLTAIRKSFDLVRQHGGRDLTLANIPEEDQGVYAMISRADTMGAQLIRNAQEHGVTVLPVDVNHSDWDCTLEEGALRLGLRTTGGLSEAHARRIEQIRPCRSVADFARRSELGNSVIKLLARADAFHSLALDRRQALWQSLAQERRLLPLLAGWTTLGTADAGQAG